MSGISKRTIFTTQLPYNNGQPNGEKVFRFAEFASVVTSVGQCWEPFTVNDIRPENEGYAANYDPKDMMRRVDYIKNFGKASSSRLMAAEDNGRPLHSFDQWVRVGP